MSTLSEIYGLKPADALALSPLSNQFVYDYFIFMGNGQYLFMPFSGKVQLVNESFITQNYITTEYHVKHFYGSEAERQSAIERGMSLIGRNYDIFSFTQEHLLSFVQEGEKGQSFFTQAISVIGAFLTIYAFVKLIQK